jgi:hypothetical protein
MSNNLLIKALYLSASLGLSACSILPDFMGMETNESKTIITKGEDSNPQPPSIMSQQDAAMGRHIQEWQRMKPSIERLVAIEGEMKELIMHLNQLTKKSEVELTAHELVAEQSSSYKTETSEKSAKLSEPSQVQLSEPKGGVRYSSSPLKKGEEAVQLASLRDKGVMTSTWNQLLGRYPKFFNALTPIYEEAMVGGQKYFRLKASGIVSKVAAIRLCKELDVQNVPCFLTSNTGDLLF